MKISCLILLAILSVVAVIECKPVSDDVEKAPCVDCKQKVFRRKRSYQFIFNQAAPAVGLRFNLGCLSCHQMHQHTIRYTMAYAIPVNRGPDIYIGNGQNNVNHVVINGANNVYIGNGAHNTNYVSYG